MAKGENSRKILVYDKETGLFTSKTDTRTKLEIKEQKEDSKMDFYFSMYYLDRCGSMNPLINPELGQPIRCR